MFGIFVVMLPKYDEFYLIKLRINETRINI